MCAQPLAPLLDAVTFHFTFAHDVLLTPRPTAASLVLAPRLLLPDVLRRLTRAAMTAAIPLFLPPLRRQLRLEFGIGEHFGFPLATDRTRLGRIVVAPHTKRLAPAAAALETHDQLCGLESRKSARVIARRIAAEHGIQMDLEPVAPDGDFATREHLHTSSPTVRPRGLRAGKHAHPYE